MYKAIIKYAIKSLSRRRGYFVINVTGFSLGFAICLLIFSWASYEFSFDKQHRYADRIYRVIEKQNFQGQDEQYLAQIPEYLTNVFERDIPEIEASTCLTYNNSLWIRGEKETIEISNVLFADNKLFKIFSFDFAAGNKASALSQPYSIVLTKSTAERIFKKENPVEKTLETDNGKIYTIKGIIKDLPQNSHIQFNAIISNEERKPGWNYNSGNHNASGYVLLKPGTDVSSLDTKLQVFMKKYLPYNTDFAQLKLQPLKDIHLNSTFTIWEINWNKFDSKYVYAFIMIAVLVLLIVISNYINLTIAYSTDRNIEVGIKKITGSGRKHLMLQFFSETVIILTFSLVIAFFIFRMAGPLLQEKLLKGHNLVYAVHSFQFYIIILGIFLFALIAGTYPAMLFSSFTPVSVLKNNLARQIKGYSLRKILIVLQFAISSVLIISLLGICKQVNYLKTKNLGYNATLVLQLPVNQNIKEHYKSIKEDLLKNPSIMDITHSNTSLSRSPWRNSIEFEGKQPGEKWIVPYMWVDYNFIDFYEMKVFQGRSFSEKIKSDAEAKSFIINETLAKKLKYDNPVGKKFRNGETPWGEIIGVIKDFHFSSLHNAIEPMLFICNQDYMGEIAIRINSQNIPATLKFLESKWKQYNPNRSFHYSFLDKTIEQFYVKEDDAGRLIIFLSVISIFLSMIGLFGLVIFLIRKRTKEIGIRKVNGARVAEVVVMLNKDFIKWVTIAFIIACPIAWYAMHRWLQSFAYKTALSWWVFAAAGAIAIVIALLTVSWQSWRAATRNPVEALRYE